MGQGELFGKRNVLQAWTDGAINIHNEKKPGGWSTVFVHDKMLICTQYAGVAPTTSQRMELTGALQALSAILDGRHAELNVLKYDTLEIVSDSAYLINCMTQLWWMEWMYNGWTTSKEGKPVQNKDLWEAIISAKTAVEATGKKLIWTKVKGHAGLMYNELADKLAVKGKMSAS